MRPTVRPLAVLLRAVNVGGRTLKMDEWRALLAAEGFEEPETLLASGNAVVTSAEPAAAVEDKVAAALQRELGLAAEAFVRDLGQLEATIAANPFTDFADESPSKLMAVFLKGEAPQDLSPLERYATMGERFAPGPGCLYIAYPEGAGRSKLANAKPPGGPGTARNWNTVRRLAERLAQLAR